MNLFSLAKYLTVGIWGMIVCLVSVLGQHQIQELEEAIQNTTGINKIRLQNQLANLYLSSSPSKAIVEVHHSFDEIRQEEENGGKLSEEWRMLKADAYNVRGEARFELGNMDAALNDFQRAMEISTNIHYEEGMLIAGENLKNWALEETEKKGWGGLGNFGKRLGESIDKWINDDLNLPLLINNAREEIAIELEKEGNYQKSMQYWLRSLSHAKKNGDVLKQQEIQTHIAELQNKMGKHEQALQTVEADIEDISGKSDSIAVAMIMPSKEISINRIENEDQVLVAKGVDSNKLLSPNISRNSEHPGVNTTSSPTSSAAPRTWGSNRYYDDLKSRIAEMEQQQKLDSLNTSIKIAEKAREVADLQQAQYKQQAILKEKLLLLEKQKYMRNILLSGFTFILGIVILLSILYFNHKKSHKKLTNTYKELEKSHEDLKATQLKLVESEKMASLGQLTAGIAHEINNPVNFISGNIIPLRRDVDDLCELIYSYEKIIQDNKLESYFDDIYLLQEEIELSYLTEEIQALLEGINEGANRTTEIVKGLRTFARVDEEASKSFDIHPGIESTLTLLQNKCQDILIEKDFGSLVPVEGYPGKINQVFMNILNNAIQAIEEKRKEDPEFNGQINIRTYKSDEEIFISIKDNGPGIPDHFKAKIFEPFFTTKEIGVGTGLGLAICLGIIEKHNGKIDIDSQKGEYTEVLIQLPIKQPKDQDTETT